MGTWGTAIFADDLAADVRDEWREAILAALTAEEATEAVTRQFAEVLDDPDEATVFWLALAAAQFETGRLQSGIRDRALGLIDEGGDVALWAEEDPALARQRQRVLERLGAKLRGPQPKAKRLRRPHVYPSPVDVGDVILVRNPVGDQALFIVVDEIEVAAERDPVVQALLWEGAELPSREDFERLPFLLSDEPYGRTLRPHLISVMRSRRGAPLPPGIEIVAKGVEREPSANYFECALMNGPCVQSGMAWELLVDHISGREFCRELAVTRAAVGGS